MRRWIALLLAVLVLLSGCSNALSNSQNTTAPQDVQPVFGALGDPALLQYVEDSVYADLVTSFESEDYIVEDVCAVYVSKEYLDEVAYNSQANIYFGYNLAELDAQFTGKRYVFTLGETGDTIVQEFSNYDDTYDRSLRNVAIGTGVILVCVVVSVASGGAGAPVAVSTVFATAAKTGAAYALSSGVISAVTAATVTGIQTGDMEQTKKAAALAGSESFKWGAISGVVEGGAGKAVELYRATKTIPTPRQSELKVKSRIKDAIEQVSYLNGKEVPSNTLGATRPDLVVKNEDGSVRAIEVKNYDLAQTANRSALLNELERQVTSRIMNLPEGSTQEIVLDIRGRKYDKALLNYVEAKIKERLGDVYPDIPVSFEEK